MRARSLLLPDAALALRSMCVRLTGRLSSRCPSPPSWNLVGRYTGGYGWWRGCTLVRLGAGVVCAGAVQVRALLPRALVADEARGEGEADAEDVRLPGPERARRRRPRNAQDCGRGAQWWYAMVAIVVGPRRALSRRPVCTSAARSETVHSRGGGGLGRGEIELGTPGSAAAAAADASRAMHARARATRPPLALHVTSQFASATTETVD